MAIRLDLNMHSGAAAFSPDDAPAEVARILRDLARQIEGGRDDHFTLRDVNGNRCGAAFLEIWDDESEEV